MMKPIKMNLGKAPKRAGGEDAPEGVRGGPSSEELEIARLAGTEDEIGRPRSGSGSAMEAIEEMTGGGDDDAHGRLGIPIMDSKSIRDNVAGGRRVFVDTLEATGFAMIDVADADGLLDTSFPEWACRKFGKRLEYSLFIDAEGKRVYASRPEMTARLLENFLVVSGRMADEIVEDVEEKGEGEQDNDEVVG